MKWKSFFGQGLCFFALALLVSVTAQEQTRTSTIDERAGPALIARGAYLAKIGDCISCHTQTKKDAPAFAGGLPIASPFGIIYSTNITPDPEYGIGNYTLEDFTRAMRKGIAKDGHYLYPAMPYPSFSKVTDEDMEALYAYFMYTVEPVAYQPPKTDLPFPISQRWGLRFWNQMFLPDHRYKVDPERSDAWNRGAYLVQGLAHCSACHTPRDIFYHEQGYTEESAAFLTGGALELWYAPNLRGDMAAGLGRWSEEDIISFLKTGHGHGSTAFGNMKDLVEKSGQYIKDEDLAAIAEYLKSLGPDGEKSAYIQQSEGREKPKASYPYKRAGEGVYRQYCARCHGIEGQGKAPEVSRLAGSSIVLSENPISLIRVVLEGETAPKTKFSPPAKDMPPYKDKLSAQDIARVLSYIRSSWGNRASPVTERDVNLFHKALEEQKEAKGKTGSFKDTPP